MILIGVVIMSLSYICIALMANYSVLINLFFALIGIGWAAINVNSYPVRFSFRACLLQDSVSVCIRIFHAGILYNAAGKTRRFKA